MSFFDSFKNVLLLTLIGYGLLKFFILPIQKDQDFEVSNNHIKFHSNWTESYDQIQHLSQLHHALTLPTVSNVDISFAMSSLSFDDILKIFPAQLQPYKTLKLNFGNINLGTKGGEYVLSLIPNGVQDLQLYLDSTHAENKFAQALANKINSLTSLRKLKLSLIISGMKDEGFANFFKTHRINNKLKDLRLVFIGNQLNHTSLQSFANYTANSQLQKFGINLYANSIQAEGAKHLAEGLKDLKIKQLEVDLYFNNITEIGTKELCQNIAQIQTLEKLNLNLDFNYIKNDGAKQVGQMFKKLPQLKEIHIGVASKNFGYLGFKSFIEGLSNQKNVTTLTLRCGVNRVGINGAGIVNKMLEGMPQLQNLNIGFIENYIGDEGMQELAQTIVTKLPKLKNLDLDVAFNDAKGYGGINVLKTLATRHWNTLQVRLSHNEFRDPDVKLMKPYIVQILKNTDTFIFEFMQTAVSRVMMEELTKLFEKNSGEHDKIFINSVIPQNEQEEAQRVARGESPKKQSKPQNTAQEKAKQTPKVQRVSNTTKQNEENKSAQKKKQQQQEGRKVEQQKLKQKQQAQRKRKEDEQKKQQQAEEQKRLKEEEDAKLRQRAEKIKQQLKQKMMKQQAQKIEQQKKRKQEESKKVQQTKRQQAQAEKKQEQANGKKKKKNAKQATKQSSQL